MPTCGDGAQEAGNIWRNDAVVAQQNTINSIQDRSDTKADLKYADRVDKEKAILQHKKKEKDTIHTSSIP